MDEEDSRIFRDAVPGRRCMQSGYARLSVASILRSPSGKDSTRHPSIRQSAGTGQLMQRRGVPLGVKVGMVEMIWRQGFSRHRGNMNGMHTSCIYRTPWLWGSVPPLRHHPRCRLSFAASIPPGIQARSHGPDVAPSSPNVLIRPQGLSHFNRDIGGARKGCGRRRPPLDERSQLGTGWNWDQY